MPAQECALGGDDCLRHPTGFICWSAMSSKQDGVDFATAKRPHPSPAALVHSPGSELLDTIKASRRSRLSSACNSALGRLVLRGTRIALQHATMLSTAASGPRGRAMPTRELVPMPAARNWARRDGQGPHRKEFRDLSTRWLLHLALVSHDAQRRYLWSYRFSRYSAS